MKGLFELANELKQTLGKFRTARQDAWVLLEQRAKTDTGAKMLLESLSQYHAYAARIKA